MRIYKRPDFYIINVKNLSCISSRFLHGIQANTSIAGGLRLLSQLSKLYITGFSWTELPEEWLWHQSKLVEFRLEDGPLETLHPTFLANTPLLKVLMVTRTRLRTLPQVTFRTVNQLSILDLSSNRIAVLPETLLHNLIGLSAFSINDNPLQDLPAKFFERQYLLSTIQLAGTELQRINSGTFAGMRLVTSIDLRYCSITHIEAHAFPPVMAGTDRLNLNPLRMEGNPSFCKYTQNGYSVYSCTCASGLAGDGTFCLGLEMLLGFFVGGVDVVVDLESFPE